MRRTVAAKQQLMTKPLMTPVEQQKSRKQIFSSRSVDHDEIAVTVDENAK
jgi:hypothetical protein